MNTFTREKKEKKNNLQSTSTTKKSLDNSIIFTLRNLMLNSTTETNLTSNSIQSNPNQKKKNNPLNNNNNLNKNNRLNRDKKLRKIKNQQNPLNNNKRLNKNKLSNNSQAHNLVNLDIQEPNKLFLPSQNHLKKLFLKRNLHPPLQNLQELYFITSTATLKASITFQTQIHSLLNTTPTLQTPIPLLHLMDQLPSLTSTTKNQHQLKKFQVDCPQLSLPLRQTLLVNQLRLKFAKLLS
jgi:hypothetical protein